MATQLSTYYRMQPGSPTVATLQPEANYGSEPGRVLRVAYAKITANVLTLAQNDLVSLFDLPAYVMPMYQRLEWGAFGSSVTLDIGFDGDENAFESGLDISSAGVQNWALVDDASELTAIKVVQAKFEAANPADTVDFEYWLMYLAKGS
jgi:hypothetical protein